MAAVGVVSLAVGSAAFAPPLAIAGAASRFPSPLLAFAPPRSFVDATRAPLLLTRQRMRHAPLQLAERARVPAWTAFVDDLNSDEWQFYDANPTWLSPCFFTCMATALSVRAAASIGLFWTYGWGPLLVLLSSVVHWVDPRRDSWRRSLDIWTVRTGMTGQWLIAIFECARGRLPLAGVGLLMAGYAIALPCYAIGRVLTVRRRNLAGACVHGGLHVFSNAGNLLMLRLVL